MRAVRIVAEEKGIDYDLHPVRPQLDEPFALHPLGRIPGFRHGTIVVGELRAIVGYLDKLFPNPPMIPSGLGGEVEQWASIVATAVDQVMIREYARPNFMLNARDGKIDRAKIMAVMPRLEAIVAVLDRALRSRDYLAGDRFSIADALLMSTLALARLFPEA